MRLIMIVVKTKYPRLLFRNWQQISIKMLKIDIHIIGIMPFESDSSASNFSWLSMRSPYFDKKSNTTPFVQPKPSCTTYSPSPPGAPI